MKILIADKLDPSAKLALEDIGHEVQEIHSVNSDDLDQHIQGIEVLSLIHISEPTRPERIGVGGVWV